MSVAENIAENLVTVAENVPKVYEAGVEASGGSYDEGYEAGQKAEYDKFWDNFQNYGNRINYAYTFAYEWTDDIYNPKYPLNVNNGAYVFYLSPITDTKVPITITATSITGFFQQCKSLITVRNLSVLETTKFATAFDGCTALENITFGGVIGNDISFKDSRKLSHVSLMSIINALKRFRENYECMITETGQFDSRVLLYGTVYDIVSMSDTSITVSTTDYGEQSVDFVSNGFSSADCSGAVKVKFNSAESFTLYFVDDTTITKTLTLPKTFTNPDITAEQVTAEIAKANQKGWTVVQ